MTEMHFASLRRVAGFLRRTPLHPQWLIGTNEKTARWIVQFAKGRILDIGCADRWIERRLPQGSDYIGLDYLATGKHMYGARPDVFADAARLPMADASVDTVIVLEVMEHLRCPQDALKEIARVLRSHGCMLLTIPFLYPVHDAPHDYQRLTVHGLVRDAEAAGLRIDTLTPTLGSAETAGLIACLAMAGMTVRLMQERRLTLILVPLLVAAIPVVNLLAWLGGRLLPSWDPITAGYRLTAIKP